MNFKILKRIKTATMLLLTCCGPAISLAQNFVKSGALAEIFAPGIISTEAGEFAPTFTGDGKTVYFTGGPTFIYCSKLVNEKWTIPVLANFSGKWKDMDPFLSPDGQRLFFSSYRPVSGKVQLKFAHIWYVERLSNGQWSAAHHLDEPVNLDGVNNYAPAVSSSGTLYFYSPNRDINHKSSYSSKWLGDHYGAPQLVPIISEGGIHDPYISPDERFLIFISGGSIYISFKTNNSWSVRQSFGPEVNKGDKNSSPCLSPDRRTLYYSSDKANGILKIPINL
ncbi:MAG: hypothetical protein JWQ79_1196 [Mucilaginibacter sp.]|nr:hypothetical protein [Mucilaginibacter sp.]